MTRPTVGLVTDSACALSFAETESLDVAVVPLRVAVAGRRYLETELSTHQLLTALQSGDAVTTSQPPAEAFGAAYRTLTAAGALEIVSVHLSAVLSGTCATARVAAATAPVPVRVVDSASVGLGLGFAVRAAAAARGGGADAVEAAIEGCTRATRVLFYVDTLEHLRRGGRIGAASALLGTTLSVKPILHLDRGRIAPLEKVRTRARALARLEDLAVESAAGGTVAIGVQHLGADAEAQELADRLRARLNLARCEVVPIGAAVGAHVGPGLLAVALQQA